MNDDILLTRKQISAALIYSDTSKATSCVFLYKIDKISTKRKNMLTNMKHSAII